MHLKKLLPFSFCMTATTDALEHLGEVLLPNRCLLCATRVCASKAMRRGGVVCAGCISDLPHTGPSCPRCAEALKPLAPIGMASERTGTPAAPCNLCRAQAPAFDHSVALWRYDFPLDGLIGAFKYRHQLALAPFFGEQLAQRVRLLLGSGDLTRPDVILAMPLHPRRLAERGFNQSLLVAKVLSRQLRLPLRSDWLQRVRHTPSQAGLPWQQRAANLEHAFRCKDDVAGCHVAVVDDVMTTGSSLQEVARTLKLAGAIRVDNWVLARTPASRVTQD